MDMLGPLTVTSVKEVLLEAPLVSGEVVQFMVQRGGLFYITGHFLEGTAVFRDGIVLKLSLQPKDTFGEGFKNSVRKFSPFLYSVVEGMGDATATIANLIVAATDARPDKSLTREIERLIDSGSYYDLSSEKKIFEKPLKVDDLNKL